MQSAKCDNLIIETANANSDMESKYLGLGCYLWQGWDLKMDSGHNKDDIRTER